MPVKDLPDVEIWFVVGSQHLYGEGPLREVAAHAREIAVALGAALPVPVVAKPLVTRPEEATALLREASGDSRCAGIILWNHTFSPAKMWINGLSSLTKPVCHFHTQYNRDLPWKSIDMDFMNLNQAAHGDREAGHLHTRLRLPRKVVVGHWTDPEALARLDAWARVVRAWADMQTLKVCRFGDNMRSVSVTDGDKVAAEVKLGFSTNGFGVGDLVAVVDAVSEDEIERTYRTYRELYDLSGNESSIRDAARLEIGLRRFLEEGGFKAFTTTFEDLHGIAQLPGLACQRLMAEGYGFGAEGDWKTAALVRFMKVVGDGLEGGTSFMEDYTYHMDPDRPQVLGSHMLEICPSIAVGKPRLEVHPLGIGGKADPARLVFDAPAGPALNASLVDLGTRFRLIVSEVEAVEVPPMPNLPVARALWETKPDFKTGLHAWILAGGAHHTGYSYAVTTEHLRDFAEIAGVELVVIDERTEVEGLKKELRWNDAYWHLAGLGRG